MAGNLSFINLRNDKTATAIAQALWVSPSIPLEPGDNEIVVQAIGTSGLVVYDSINIYRERHNTVPPEISVTNILLGSATQLLLQGTASQNLVGMMEYDQITVGFTTSNAATSVWQSPGLPFISGANTIAIIASNKWGLTGSVNFVWQTDSDDDGDGIDNQSELISGTDFSDIQSYFSIDDFVVMVNESNRFIVEWDSKPNRQYSVLWSTNLVDGFQPLEGADSIEHPQNSYTDTLHNAESGGYYKIDVRLK